MNEPIQITDIIKNGFLDYYKNNTLDIFDITEITMLP